MQIYKVVNMLAALNDTNRLASDMYELGKSLYFCETKQEYIPISQMDFQHMIRAFKRTIKQVEELKEDLYDNQVKIKELCKEGDKLESKLKKLKALNSDIRLLTEEQKRMAVERDQLSNELPKKRNYDKLYLDITIEVLEKMMEQKKDNQEIVEQLDKALLIVQRENYDN